MVRFDHVAIVVGFCALPVFGQQDPGSCSLDGLLCNPEGVACTASDGKSGTCVQKRYGCECAPYNVCHFSKSTRTYSPIRVSERAIAKHQAHGDCVIDDGVDCSIDHCDKNLGCVHSVLECVTVEGVREHQAAFQAIADANGGTRMSGTPGYDASAAYVEDLMTAAGYHVTVQVFQFQTFILLSPPILEMVSPIAGPIANNIMTYSGSGDVTAAVTALAAPPGDPTPGCEAADFAGFPAGNIALIDRGFCTFAIKATNAYNAGASGVVIYNNQPGPLNGTLGNDFSLNIGVTAVTLDIGQQLAATPGLVMRLKTDTFRGLATSSNVLAESPGGDPENVVMVGAHLDSVNAGPGIQDNGSGSAAILEVAEQFANLNPLNKLRFVWWGAEESGLIGSTYYVSNLSAEERGKIALYLNFDMIGSPNHVFFIYDGDDSDGVGFGPGPEGSAQIEMMFEDFYNSRGLPFKGTDFSGRSDYGPFIIAGIPSGGLFTGAEGIKSAEEAAIWGGTAGVAYDPCYHLACDTFANINLDALEINSAAVAAVTFQAAMSAPPISAANGQADWGTERHEWEFLGAHQQK